MLHHDSPSDRLARFCWAGELFFEGYGARIGVRFTDRDLGAQLALRPSPGTHLAPPGRVDRMLSVFRDEGRYWIYGDDEMKCQPELRADLLDAFDTHLRAAFAEFARHTLFVHGGVVGWKGKAVIFPGKSQAGKSTLVAALVKAGAEYFSDEYAVLDETGHVHPFAKPLSLREAPGSRQRELPVEALGGIPADRPLPVGLVVLAQYRDNARWNSHSLTPGEGALEILAHTIAARRWPAFALSVLGAVASQAKIIQSDRGEASDTVPSLMAIMDDIAGNA